MIEADIQSVIRIEAARVGLILWRNNSGVLPDRSGRTVRFGLGNDSPATNKVCKSSDLIGIWFGRFVAVECKPDKWRWTGTDREIAQKAFLDLVRANGGIALFATSWKEVEHELARARQA